MALLSRAQHKYEYAGQACLVSYVLCWYYRFSHCTNFLCEILAALALLFFLLRFLTPRGIYFLLNFSCANPREAAHVLTTIDFEQLVLCVTLHILPHSADLLAGAATAIEHAATIFRAAGNRERKISAAALQMRMEILCQTHPRREKSTSVMLASSAVWSRRLDLLMHSRQIAWNVRQFPVWQKLRWIFCNPVSPVLIYRSIPATDRRNTDACPSKSSRSFCTRVYLKTALSCAKGRKRRRSRRPYGDCTEDTIVGCIAKYKHIAEGAYAYDPVFVLSAILDWAGIAHNERGYLEQKNMRNMSGKPLFVHEKAPSN